MGKSKAKKSKPKRQQAPPPPKAERKISDRRLMSMLEEHMQDSLSDIAVLYQRLFSQLGYKGMSFEEKVKVQTSISLADRALDTASAIAGWRVACNKRKLDSRIVMMVIADGASVTRIMRVLRLTRECVRVHMRACLTIWSFWRRRCSTLEVNKEIMQALACCPLRKLHKIAKAQQLPAVLAAC